MAHALILRIFYYLQKEEEEEEVTGKNRLLT